MELYKKSNGKKYTLRKNGRIVFVGKVWEIADRFNFDTAQIYDSIRRYGTFLGMEVTEANPTDKTPSYTEAKIYQPKVYRDSSSRRFTPL